MLRDTKPSGDELFESPVRRSILGKGADARLKGRTVGGFDDPVNRLFGGFRRQAKARNDARGVMPPGFFNLGEPTAGRCHTTALAMFGRTTVWMK